MRSGYTKLFQSILASTIWREDDKTRIVWITMLAMSNQYGIVEASIPGLADFARVSISEAERALAKLSAPDTYSRTKDHEGRRIRECEGGWQLLNHGKYRDLMSGEDRKEYNRIKQSESRARRQNSQPMSATVNIGQECQPLSTGVSDRDQTSAPSAHTEAEADTEAKREEVQDLLTGNGARTNVDELIQVWNDTRKPGPLLRKPTGTLRSQVRKALRDVPNLEDWRTVIRYLNGQDWANAKGVGQHASWRAALDWLTKPGKCAQYLEQARLAGSEKSSNGRDAATGRVGTTPGKFAGLGKAAGEG